MKCKSEFFLFNERNFYEERSLANLTKFSNPNMSAGVVGFL